MAIFDITYVGDMPYLKLEGGTVTGDTIFNNSVTANSASITNNLAVGSINGVTVGSSPKFTDTVATTTTSGSGNAVTEITASNGALTVTKGTSFSTSTHTHGNITNAGDITATATIASGDRLVINDESASKITNSSITFGTDTSKFLRNDGTWASISSIMPAIYHQGAITALSNKKQYGASVSLSNYIIFAGGLTDTSHYTSIVDAYNSSLTRSTPTALSETAAHLAGAKVGSYALFAGGYGSSSHTITTVNAYNSSLTRSNPTALSSARMQLGGASIGNYALFAGGSASYSNGSTTIDAYNSSLTRSTPTALSVAMEPVGISTSNYAFFGGTTSTVTTNVVNIYNSSLTRSIPSTLESSDKQYMSGYGLDKYAFFGGGKIRNTPSIVIEVYNESLVLMSTNLNVGRYNMIATNLSSLYVLFGGGSTISSSSIVTQKIVEAIDTSLTVTQITPLDNVRVNAQAGSIGNYAVFAGGFSSSVIADAEAYTIF